MQDQPVAHCRDGLSSQGIPSRVCKACVHSAIMQLSECPGTLSQVDPCHWILKRLMLSASLLTRSA